MDSWLGKRQCEVNWLTHFALDGKTMSTTRKDDYLYRIYGILSVTYARRNLLPSPGFCFNCTASGCCRRRRTSPSPLTGLLPA
jgi:hypothetical protein